ncbi:MAG: 2-hydroxyacyl-CoA dehydratase [Oscillospiraceae bacterium]|nr:2-hydroxyacyl-CoA dehydratase [Oscillospiraceae bacterium]
MTGYSCKYTPVELLLALGAEPERFDAGVQELTQADMMTHQNLCSHARAVLEQYRNKKPDGMVFVNCCDSLRRCFDAVKGEGAAAELLDLPHAVNETTVNMFAAELCALAESVSARTGKVFDKSRFFAAFEERSLPAGDYIALLGARTSSDFFREIEKAMPLPVVDLTCAGNRAPEKPDDSDDFRQLMLSYARSLLTQPPCLRMRDVSGRGKLTGSGKMKGVIYHTVKFCDYYSFEFENLKKTLEVPILKIEIDFTAQSAGQISTRLEAFAEGFTGVASSAKKAAEGDFVAGIDSGSTSTNMVILRPDGTVAAGVSVRTGPRAELGAKKALAAALEQAGISENQIIRTVATGYGRTGVTFAHRAVTEITCHARGAHRMNGDTRTIIDIGGQDSKVICLNSDGTVKGFAMNDKCAAGTGRFLEKMAQTLDMEMGDFCAAGLRWKKDVTISSVCTVFAESEIVSLVAENTPEEDVIHGLNRSVAVRTAALVKRAGGAAPFMMTGGVARNPGVIAALEQELGSSIFVSENPDLCGALGAALFALDDVQG